MITSTLMALFARIIFLMGQPSDRPVKLRILMIFIRIYLFLTVIKRTGNVWFPMMYTLLVVGGIVLMFIILSSVLPNRTIKKEKYKVRITFIWIMSCYVYSLQRRSISTEIAIIKQVLSAHQNMVVMMTLIILYFLSFIYVLSRKKERIQAVVCSI